MLDAREYLAEKGKLEDESTEDVLYEKIWNRYKLLDGYTEDNFGRMEDLLDQAEREEKQRVEEKAEEMEEKYSQ